MSAPNSTYKLYLILAFAAILSVSVRGGIDPPLAEQGGLGIPEQVGGPGELGEEGFEGGEISDVEFDVLASAAIGVAGQGEPGEEMGPGGEERSPQITAEPAPEGAEGVNQVGGTEDPGKSDLKIFQHQVVSGESLWNIAKDYGVEIDTIIAANNLPDADQLKVGQTLKVPNMDGAMHEVRRGESLWEIAREYNVSVDKIIETNGLDNPSSLQVKQELFIPGGQRVAAQRYRLVSRTGQLQRAFDWPVRGWISSRFGPRWGRMHEGLDIAVVTGTPVRASADGRVKFAGSKGGYGLLVIIDHGQGVETRYGHNSRLLVKAGQTVSRGQVIAKSGNTGNSTGPHVHFEIRRNGRAYDPLKYLVSR